MSAYASGTQARDGHTANHDPKPWRCVEWRWCTNHESGPCRSAKQNRHNCQLDPRSEFAVLDNPILADFRRLMAEIIPTGPSVASPAEAKKWLALLVDDDKRRAANGFDYPHTREHLNHARRVLCKLAALRMTAGERANALRREPVQPIYAVTHIATGGVFEIFLSEGAADDRAAHLNLRKRAELYRVEPCTMTRGAAIDSTNTEGSN